MDLLDIVREAHRSGIKQYDQSLDSLYGSDINRSFVMMATAAPHWAYLGGFIRGILQYNRKL